MSGWGVPPGIAVPINLTTAWGVPPGSAVPLVLGPDGVQATGWESSAFGTAALATQNGVGAASITSTLAFGTPLVYNLRQYVLQTSIAPTLAFGSALVWNYRTYAVPVGIAAGAHGTPTVYNKSQFITHGGSNFLQFGAHAVFDPTQTVSAVGGIAPATFPTTHYVADYFQYIDFAGWGQQHGGVGTPFVAYRVRTIIPPFIYTNAFGTATVEEVVYTPQPWVSSAFGTAFVSLYSRILAHLAQPPTLAVGVPDIGNRNRSLRAGTIDPPVFPPPLVYNQDVYLESSPYEFNNPPNAFGTAGVANRNRVLNVAGFFRERFGNRTDTFVVNGARALAPSGIPSLTWGPETFIAHYIRYVAPPSLDTPPWLRRAIVYNDAFLVQPPSLGDTSVFGRPDPVFSNLQWLRNVGGNDHAVFGTAFIAPAIRSVYPRTMPALFAGFPEVRFNPHPIAPASIAKPVSPGPFGHAVLRIFLREARPTSANLPGERMGEPFIQNRNRALRVQPIVRMEFGLTRVFNRNQYLLPEGLLSLRVGTHRIADRTQRVLVGSVGAPSISLIHRIRNLIPDPPGAQYVSVASMAKGISPHYVLVPSPEVRHPTIYPDGWDSAKYGTAVVRTNSIYPQSIADIDRFGTPWIAGDQYVYPDHETPWLNAGGVGRPQLSPHTIYGPPSSHATAQAKANHPAIATLHPVTWPTGDGRWSEGDGWPWFGLPEISTSPRYLTPSNGNQQYPKYGQPSVELRRRRVYPTPIRGPRFGPVIILNVPQDIVFDEDNPGIPFTGEFGTHTVAFPPEYPPQILVGDIDFTEFGEHSVDLFNREIAPAGIPHRGNPQQDLTSPWGTAMVGYPREYVITAGDQALWGTHIIEYLNRQVWPEGWDSLTLIDDSLNDFRYRMRVTRRNPVNAASGIAPTNGVGVPTVSFRVRTLGTFGIWPGYGGIPRIGMTVTPTGWEDTVFGDIDEWVPGTVKPHGDEMFSPGYPRMGRVVQPASIDDGAFGGTRFAWSVRVSGMPPIGFDGPSVTDEYGCSRRVVTTWPIQAPTFPTPVVTQ